MSSKALSGAGQSNSCSKNCCVSLRSAVFSVHCCSLLWTTSVLSHSVHYQLSPAWIGPWVYTTAET